MKKPLKEGRGTKPDTSKPVSKALAGTWIGNNALSWREIPNSSNIAAVAYLDETATLFVRFQGSGVYLYQGVSLATAKALVDAPSVGRYFHEHIKSVGVPCLKVGA